MKIKINKELVKNFSLNEDIILEKTNIGTILYNATHTKCFFDDLMIAGSSPIIFNVKLFLNSSICKYGDKDLIDAEINSHGSTIITKYKKIKDETICNIHSSINSQYIKQLDRIRSGSFNLFKNHIKFNSIYLKAKDQLIIYKNNVKIIKFNDKSFNLKNVDIKNIDTFHNEIGNLSKMIECPMNIDNKSLVVIYDLNSLDYYLYINNNCILRIDIKCDFNLQLCTFILKKLNEGESTDITDLKMISNFLDKEMSDQLISYIKSSNNIDNVIITIDKNKILTLKDITRNIDLLNIQLLEIDTLSLSDISLFDNEETLGFPAKLYPFIILNPNNIKSFQNSNVKIYSCEFDEYNTYIL